MLVVPFVLEATFSGTYGGRTWANIQHLEWDADGAARNATNMLTIASALSAAWSGQLAAAMNSLVSLVEVKLLDLDSVSGLSVVEDTGGVGTRSGDPMPGNVAVLATKGDAHSRSQRPGRAFWVGVVETATDSSSPDLLTSTAHTYWQSAADAYYADLSGTSGGSTYKPVVLHKPAGGGTLVPYAMTGLDVEFGLATQRRRLRG